MTAKHFWGLGRDDVPSGASNLLHPSTYYIGAFFEKSQFTNCYKNATLRYSTGGQFRLWGLYSVGGGKFVAPLYILYRGFF